MIAALVVAAAVLAADPVAGAAAPVPAKKGNYLRLAAPMFSGVNVDPKVASFFSEHFAGALVRHGLLVLTPSEINAMIGLERSKQLAGCTEEASSCVAELSNALGVDGLVVGTVAKFGTTLQANIKVFASGSGASVKAVSVKAAGEEAFLEALSQEAAVVAPDVLQRMGKEAAPTLEVEPAKAARVNIVSAGVLPALASAFLARFGQFYSLEYERVLNDWAGIFVAPTLLTYQLAPETFLPREDVTQERHAPFRANLLRLEFGARLYWPGKAPGGWWASPSVGVGSGDVGIATKNLDQTVTTEMHAGLDFSAGLALGYRWYPWEYVPVTVGLGGEWHSLELVGLPNARLHVGFAW